MAYEYQKIQAIFRRDTEGSRKCLFGSFADPQVEYTSDLDWICTEKIDGTNVRIIWDGHQVNFYGRKDTSTLPKAVLSVLETTFGTPEAEELFEQTWKDETVVLYGEAFGGNIQKVGKQYSEDISFALFDVYIPSRNDWYRRPDMINVSVMFGVPAAPIVFIGKLPNAIKFVKEKHESRFQSGTSEPAMMEGLVCRPLIDIFNKDGERLITKIKVRDICEED